MGIAPKRLWAMGADQIDLLIASDEIERDVGHHGQPMSEATSDEADPNNYEGAYRYVAHPVVDWAERAIKDARKTLQSTIPDEDLSDTVFVVERIDNESPAEAVPDSTG